MSGSITERELSSLRKMENCFLDSENVTVLHNAKLYRASLFEFQMRYPEVRVFIDEDTIYLVPGQNALQKFAKMLIKRRARIEKRYEEITREYNSIVSLYDAVCKYE